MLTVKSRVDFVGVKYWDSVIVQLKTVTLLY